MLTKLENARKKLVDLYERYRKGFVAAVAAGIGVWGVIEKADLSTSQGCYAAAIAILGVFGVVVAPNDPKA